MNVKKQITTLITFLIVLLLGACGESQTDNRLKKANSLSACLGDVTGGKAGQVGNVRNIALASEKGIATGLMEQVKYLPFEGIAFEYYALIDSIYHSSILNKRLIDGDLSTRIYAKDWKEFERPNDDYYKLHLEETEGVLGADTEHKVQVINPTQVSKLVLHGNMNWGGVKREGDLRDSAFELFRVYKNRPLQEVKFKRAENQKHNGFYIETYSAYNPCSQLDAREEAQSMKEENLDTGYNGGGIALGHPKSVTSCYKGDPSRKTYKFDPCNEGNGDVWCKVFKLYDQNGLEMDPLKTQKEVARFECVLNRPLPKDHGLVVMSYELRSDASAYISEFEMIGK